MKNISGLEYSIHSISGRKCKVTFKNTGSTRKVLLANAKAGKVKDLFEPAVAGIGYLGNATFLREERVLWKNILHRLNSHKAYADCAVCIRWHSLENFIEDIRDMEGYDKWLLGGYDLDKDLKYKGNKVYSKEFCSFIPREVNMALGKRTMPDAKTYLAIHIGGTEVTFQNQRTFANEYGLCYKNLNRSIKKGGKTKGWKVIELTGKE